MRTLANLNVPKDESAQFPYGTIQNETDTQDGTPVVREYLGDVLTNLWKLFPITGVTPTGDEDSDDTQYQLVEALKKLVNSHNDIEQIVSLSSTTWQVDLNLDLLPNKYVFIARASDNYDASVNYEFRGTTLTVYSATSPTGFSTNDEIIVVVDTSEVRMYSITRLTDTQENSTINVYGAPISFNDTNTMYYFESGKIYTEIPKIYDIEETLRISESNASLIISDVIVFKGKMLAMVYEPATLGYKIFKYELSNLDAAPLKINITNPYIPGEGTDYDIYMYCDGDHLYLSNDYNNTANDEDISKFDYDEVANTLTFVSTVSLVNGNFKKTTNTVLANGKLYTFIDNKLDSYDLATATYDSIFANYSLYYGAIFKFNESVYFSNNGVSKKWTL